MKYNYNYRDEQGNPAPKMLNIDGCQVWNPTAEQYAAHGYMPYTPPEPVPPTDEEIAAMQRQARTEDLRKAIAKIDWKIIKTSEYRLVGKPDPYDTMALHEERQALRDEINALEAPQE